MTTQGACACSAPDFVGRDGELATLTSVLAGPPAVVLVEGDVPPLVFLRYNARASLDNTLTAPGHHVLQITAYQDPTAPPVNT